MHLDQPSWADRATLRRLAQSLTRDDAEADDLAQDAWLAVHGDPQAVRRGWVARVSRNLLRMRRRAERRRHRRESDYAAQRGEVGDAEDHSAAAALAAAMQTLPAEDRALILARYVEGYSAVELGARHSVPASTIRTRLSRAKAQLRAALDEQWSPGWHAWAIAIGFPAEPRVASGPAIAGMVTLAGLTVGVACAGLSTADEPPPVNPVVRAEPVPPAPAPQETPGHVNPSPKRAKIVEARRQRERLGTERLDGAAAAGAAALRTSSSLPGASLDEPVAEIARGCAELLDDTATGKLSVQTHIIGEPGVGTIVDTVEIIDDTIGHPEFSECWVQSVFSVDFEAPASALVDQHVFTYRADDRSLVVQVPLDPTRLLDYLEVYPELAEAVPEVLEADADEDPELREVQKELWGALGAQ